MSTTRERDMLTARRFGYRNSAAVHFADGCAHRDSQVVDYLEREADKAEAAGLRITALTLRQAATNIVVGFHVP